MADAEFQSSHSASEFPRESSPFEKEQFRLLNAAHAELEALGGAREAARLLAEAVEGTKIPLRPGMPPEEAGPAAVVLLALLAVRTAYPLLVLVAAGWAPEAHGLKRRMQEICSEIPRVLTDHSGEAARRWLEGKSAGNKAALVTKWSDVDVWRLLGESVHPNVRHLRDWMWTDPEGDSRGAGFDIMPRHYEQHSNALLIQLAFECRQVTHAVILLQHMADGPEVGGDEARVRLADLDAEIERLSALYAVDPAGAAEEEGPTGEGEPETHGLSAG